jgi:hypothetical protein
MGRVEESMRPVRQQGVRGRRALFAMLVAIAAAQTVSPVEAEETPTADEPRATDESVESAEEPGSGNADPLAYARPGAWLGVGGAFALEHFDRDGSYDDSGVLSFRAGYRGTPHLAVELLGEVLPEFEGDGARDGDVRGFLVTANGKIFLPGGFAEPWLMTGIGFLDIDANHRQREDDIAFRFAAGLDAYLTPHWAIYLEAAYILPTGDVSDYRFSTYGAGLLFRF